MSTALRQHLAAMPGFEIEEIITRRVFEIETLAERFAVSTGDVWEELKSLRPKPSHDGFQTRLDWREAILKSRKLTHPEKLAALTVEIRINSATLYAWPSQKTLAAEFGYTRGPNFGKVLKPVYELGALAPVLVKNLPEELRDSAVNGSKRSLRGIAYRLYPVDQWEVAAKEFAALQESNRFRRGTLEGSSQHHLNHELNHELASPGSSHTDVGDSPLTTEGAETYSHSVMTEESSRRAMR